MNNFFHNKENTILKAHLQSLIFKIDANKNTFYYFFTLIMTNYYWLCGNLSNVLIEIKKGHELS